MKIGILTLPFNNNYGGFLQCYALMTILKQMGHHPILINRRHNISYDFKVCIKYFIKQLIKTIKNRKCFPLFWKKDCYYFEKGVKMHLFVDKYMYPQTKYLYSRNELRKEIKNNNFDALIVGSDQVWRPIYVPNIEDFFFDGTEEIQLKRISYAASFGTNKPEYTEEQRILCGNLLKAFDAVSVREKSALNIFKAFGWYGINVTTVLDPTLLLDKDHYVSLLHNIKESSNKIYCYVLDKNEGILNVITAIKSNYNKPITEITIKGSQPLPSIEEWLANFRDADVVVTDSFHGMVFSIIFRKQFWVCLNDGRGSDRFISLLDELELSSRIIHNQEDYNNKKDNMINWNIIEPNLKLMEEKSIQFLKKSLCK